MTPAATFPYRLRGQGGVQGQNFNIYICLYFGFYLSEFFYRIKKYWFFIKLWPVKVASYYRFIGKSLYIKKCHIFNLNFGKNYRSMRICIEIGPNSLYMIPIRLSKIWMREIFKSSKFWILHRIEIEKNPNFGPKWLFLDFRPA